MEINIKRKYDENCQKSRKKIKEEKFLGRLEKDSYEYFSRIADVLKQTIDDEELEILAENSLQQTEGIEIDVCNHTMAAGVLEKIIPYASWSHIKRLTEAMEKQTDEKSNCESRLEEAIIKEAGRRIRLNESPNYEECLQYLINLSKHIVQDFDNGIWNCSTNYAARTCLSICSGYEEKEANKDIISKKIVKKFKTKLMAWPDLADNYHHAIISGFLQILLFSLKTVSEKSCKKFATFLFETCFIKDIEEFSKGSICELFENVSWSRLLEAIIDVAPSELHEDIYQKLFNDHMESLIISKKAQYSVCKLIKSCRNKTMLETILDKLKDKFSELLSGNSLNILHALSEACLNTGEKQGEFIKNLITALGCSGPNKDKYVIICIISMKLFNEVNLEEVTVNFHGSLIMQNLLKFKKPQKLVEAFLSLNMSVLKFIMTDSKGCHVTDAFLDSTYVGAKSKDRLLHTLKGQYSDLAMDKYGSRSFDVIWAKANMKNRAIILSELNRQILKTRFGSIIASKTGLEMFIKDKQAWEKAYNNNTNYNKSNLFADIIRAKK